jgi:hypothetical protein
MSKLIKVLLLAGLLALAVGCGKKEAPADTSPAPEGTQKSDAGYLVPSLFA